MCIIIVKGVSTKKVVIKKENLCDENLFQIILNPVLKICKP